MLTLVCLAGVLTGMQSEPTIDTGTLLRELVDLERLTRLPAPDYRTVQYSSYDRTSAVPGGPGWFANSDGFGGEPTPNFVAVQRAPDAAGQGEYLVCDVRGPGAIVRTWTAGMDGRLQLFLDEQPEPLYDGPAAEFLACPYRAWSAAAGLAPEDLEPLVQRQAAYCPLPFAERCRIVWTGDVKGVHFYHVQVRRYAPGTRVRTFTPDELAAQRAELRAAGAVLRSPDANYRYRAERAPEELLAQLAPGQRQELYRLEGPAAIERLALRVLAADPERALRQTLLQIYCDDHPRPQVEAPLGDFFGAAPGINPFDALPFTVRPDGTLVCRYWLPCRTGLRIVVTNRGPAPVAVGGSALACAYPWDAERSLHLRARWRVNHGIEAAPDDVQDLPFLVAGGAGRYVGTTILLMNPCEVPTTYGGWWGEGDEKIFVDGDAFPSTFGTGSEDYFNYAWSVPDLFSHAYCGQPRCDGPGNRGFVTNQRWHILDDLPFAQRLAFYMELFPHDRVRGMSYARIAYHYARPGTLDDHVAPTDEDLRPPALPPTWAPAARLGMRNAVYHEAEALADARPDTALRSGPLWSGGALLAWTPRAAGEALALAVPIAADGAYALHVVLAHTPDSGRVSFRVDGRPTAFGAPTLALHTARGKLARQYGADVLTLTRGLHTLALVYEGADDSTVNPVIGIDFIAVQQR